MFDHPRQYLIQEWDGSLELVKAVHHPVDPPDTLRVLYPEGDCHKVAVSYFTGTLGAVPAYLH